MIVEVGRDLAHSFVGVLEALPGAPHRPQWLARSLGVNTVLTSRLLKAAQQRDPMAVTHMIPGPEPLRRLLRAAERKKVDPELISEARRAVDRFEQLISIEAGDRSSLDAIISGWLPEAREKVELIAKQSVYRGVSQILGTACESEHSTCLMWPSAQVTDRADQVWMLFSRGLRRVRPGLVIKYDTVHSTTPLQTLAGEPVEGLRGLLLEQFCSQPLPQLQVSHREDRVQYTHSGEGVGMQSAVNLVHATFLPARKELYRAPDAPPRKAAVAVGIAMPSRMMTFDVLVHEDIYPGQQPTLHVYRGTVGDGAVDINDASRDVNRLEMIESLQPLGQGVAKFRAAGNPAYLDMLRHVCEQRGWDGRQLRGFRCRIEYPMYSSQIVMAFDLPAKT